MNVQLRWLLISCIHKIKMLQLLLVPEAPPSTMQDTSQLLLSHWPAFCSSGKSLLTALGFCFRPQSGPVAFFFFFFNISSFGCSRSQLWLVGSLVAACRIWFPDQGSNLAPGTGSVESQPLDHQGSPTVAFSFPFSVRDAGTKWVIQTPVVCPPLGFLFLCFFEMV